jgi:hypothetical protein
MGPPAIPLPDILPAITAGSFYQFDLLCSGLGLGKLNKLKKLLRMREAHLRMDLVHSRERIVSYPLFGRFCYFSHTS